MLRQISFKNYKAFKARQTINLKPMTILVGPNSAGKSSIIKLIGLLKQSIGHDSSMHELLNLKGHIFNLVDFKNISYRKELNDIELELRSPFTHYEDSEKWKGQYDSAPISNGENRIQINLSNELKRNHINYTIEKTDSPKKSVKIDKLELFWTTEPENAFRSEYVDLLRDHSLKIIKRHLSKILNKQLGKPGFYPTKDLIDHFINERIRYCFQNCIGKTGLRPDISNLTQKRITHLGAILRDIGEMSLKGTLVPYPENFILPSNLTTTGILWYAEEKDKEKDIIECPFPFYWPAGEYGIGYLIKPNIFEEKDSVTDYFDAINEHYNNISKFIDDEECNGFVSLQVFAYLEIIFDVLPHLFPSSESQRYSKNKSVRKYPFQEALDNKVKLLSLNLRDSLRGINFSPSLRAHPEKLQTKEDLEKKFNIYPSQDFKNWNEALKDMGFNYDISIEIISKAHDIYAIKLRDRVTNVESYLDEVGYGFSQFLPYLGIKFGPSGHQILEQPELHLHPLAQARLPEVLLKMYRLDKYPGELIWPERYPDDNEVGSIYVLDEEMRIDTKEVPIVGTGRLKSRHKYLIETHSEHIVRGVQVLVAKGNLEKDDVAVYYVGKHRNGNSYVKEMEMTETGLFNEAWPGGLFEDAFNQSRELLKYQ